MIAMSESTSSDPDLNTSESETSSNSYPDLDTFESTSNDSDLDTISSQPSVYTSAPLEYAVTHVFLPVRPPTKSDYTPENNHSLASAVCAAAHAYSTHLSGTSEQAQWLRITKMLDNLQAAVHSGHMDHELVISQLRGMQTGGEFREFPSNPC